MLNFVVNLERKLLALRMPTSRLKFLLYIYNIMIPSVASVLVSSATASVQEEHTNWCLIKIIKQKIINKTINGQNLRFLFKIYQCFFIKHNAMIQTNIFTEYHHTQRACSFHHKTTIFGWLEWL